MHSRIARSDHEKISGSERGREYTSPPEYILSRYVGLSGCPVFAAWDISCMHDSGGEI